MLLQADKPVRIGGRALDILAVLVEHAGEVVSKDTLIARVWPGTIVTEVSLRVHVAALRRALGEGEEGRRYVATIAGRGYRFVAPVATASSDDLSDPAEPIGARYDLPPPMPIIGRTGIISALVGELARRRCVTIAGPGGIGKTTVALAIAESMRSHFADGVCFVDLAPLADPLLVPSVIGSRLGVPVVPEGAPDALIPFLREKRMLLVLDSCEGVVDAAAPLAEPIFGAAPGVHILATSREPLGATGERVRRLPPLATPAPCSGLSAAEAMSHSAVELFVERVTDAWTVSG